MESQPAIASETAPRNGGAGHNRKEAARVYFNNMVQFERPLDRVLTAYDIAAQACARGDRDRILRAINVLRKGLDFEHSPEIAGGLLRVYVYCEDLARREMYSELENLLHELRVTWTELKALTRTGK